MPTTDIIQPLHRLPFTDLSPDGVQGIAMNPVAPTVYVHVHQQLVDPLAVALAYWPWVLTPIAVLLLAFILWRTLRILSRPQRKGVPHCRKCNYDLSGAIVATPTAPLSLGALTKGEGRGEGSTPPAFSPSSTSLPSVSCPECGRTLTPRTILKGRSTRRRLAPLAIPLAALLLIAALAAGLAFKWRPALPAWPSTTAQRIADRFGISVPKAFSTECSTILEVDLDRGETIRTLLCHAPKFWDDFDVDPTGMSMIVPGPSGSGAVIRVSTVSGRTLARLDPPAAIARLIATTNQWPDTNSPCCGFASDGSSAFVVMHGPTPATTQVLQWSFSDQSTRVIADIPVFDYKPGGVRGWACCVLLIPGAPGRVLSCPNFAEAFGRGNFEIATQTAELPPLSGGLDTITGRYEPVGVTADRSRIYFVRERGSLAVADTGDLRVSEIGPQPTRSVGNSVAVDATGRLVAAGGFGVLAIRDMQSQAWIGTLTMPTDLYGAVPRFSSNDQFVIARAQSGKSQPYHHELLIWDLAPLRARLQLRP